MANTPTVSKNRRRAIIRPCFSSPAFSCRWLFAHIAAKANVSDQLLERVGHKTLGRVTAQGRVAKRGAGLLDQFCPKFAAD